MTSRIFALLLAGMAGTLCRYAITVLPWPKSFTFGTLAVNLPGAMLAGFCFIWLNGKYPQHAAWFPVLFAGFFGAFTTFSTFMLDSAKYLTSGHYALFVLNICLQNSLGLGCAIGGMMLAKKLFSL